jgi:hypothetical protein
MQTDKLRKDVEVVLAYFKIILNISLLCEMIVETTN